MRYTKQLRKDDCVPTCLVNALKWAGKKVSYRRSFEYLYRYFDIKTIGGVFPEMLLIILSEQKYLPFKIKDGGRHISKAKLFKSLNKNTSVIYMYSSDKINHAVFLFKDNNDIINCVNMNRKYNTVTIVKDKFFKNFKCQAYFLLER